jgi:hypothetical protein
LENRNPQKETHNNKAILGCCTVSVALKIETKEMIRNKYLNIGIVINPIPYIINNGVAIQCTKQIEELKIPIISALLIFVVLIIGNILKPFNNIL